jgi:CubicO group peptidase (beta-lactamase class C family)
MKSTIIPLLSFCFILLTANSSSAVEDDYVRSVNTFLQGRFAAENACMVVGSVDQHGSHILSFGKLDNGTDQDPNGDTVFLIGSVSKTFTTSLFQDMVDRGELSLNDPVARYLPKSVKMPTHGGKEITLLDLATHTAGFPINPDNMTGKDFKEQYETYTVEKMYAFLSAYTLRRDLGAEFEYSNVGMALLGHVLELKAGTDFESLVVDRICRPLRMNSTVVTLTPQLRARLAMGHDKTGNPSPPWNMHAYAPAGSICSTANDLLKYASAQAGLAPSVLATSMAKTHVIRHTDSRGLVDLPGFGTFGQTAMDWTDRGAFQPPGMQLLGHAGGAGSYHAWVGFDMKQHRGVVVLSTANDLSVEAIGWTLLQQKPLTPDSAKDFEHELVGIGVALDLDEQTKSLVITKVFANSPAAQAGLSPGLIIQKIGDTPLEGKTLADSIKLLRGSAGTKVQLVVIEPAGKTNSVEITRQKFLIVQ